MDCQAIEKYQSIPEIQKAGWRSWLLRLMRGPSLQYPPLDLEVMSEYMKRDLGFLDGRDPRRHADMTR